MIPPSSASPPPIPFPPSAQTFPPPPDEAHPGRKVRAAWFGAGVLTAAIPLVTALEKLAEHPQALQVALDVVRVVGWPGLVVVAAVVLMRKQAEDHRATLHLIGNGLQGAVQQLVTGLSRVEQRVDALHGRLDATGPHPRQ